MYTDNKTRFASRIDEKICNGIAQLTNQLFDLFRQHPLWLEKRQELDYEHRSFINAPITKKIGWFFFLFVLLSILGAFDLSSVSSFLAYLAARSGNPIVAFFIYCFGWFIFTCVELGIGFVLIYSKDKPALRIVAYCLVVAITLLPSFLIYETYALSDDKSILLLSKTAALMLMSLILHVLFFLVVRDVWSAISYYYYKAHNWVLMSHNPERKMEQAKTELHNLFADFDRYVVPNHMGDISLLLDNRAWYLKRKFQGHSTKDCDFSDYEPTFSYAPISTPRTASQNGTYSYSVKS